jgi:hypothetical protein
VANRDAKGRAQSAERAGGKASWIADVAQNAGAAVTIWLALLLAAAIGIAALILVPGGDRSTVATAVLSAIGTIAGGYAGIRVGAHGKAESDKALTAIAAEQAAAGTASKKAGEDPETDRPRV